jgi:hypothetical protein
VLPSKRRWRTRRARPARLRNLLIKVARELFEEADLSHAQLGDAGFGSAVANLYLMLLCT